MPDFSFSKTGKVSVDKVVIAREALRPKQFPYRRGVASPAAHAESSTIGNAMTNRRHYLKGLLLVLCIAASFAGCKKEIIENTIYDNVIYDLDTVAVYSSSAEKTKQKSSDQYISILYADLFKKTIPSSELLKMSELALGSGDKQLLNELIMSSYLNDTDVKVPTDAQMRQDLDKFIDETYIRFFLRHPTEYERYFLKNLIQNDPGMTPDLVYSSFALSNEYLFY